MTSITNTEKNLIQQNDITKAYQNFVNLVQSGVELKLKGKRGAPRATKYHESRAKIYWNSELQDM